VPLASLYQGLKHPGEGSKTFPGTRKEAVGRFVLGSAYPRVADREELTKQALKKLPTAERYYRENLIEAQKAAAAAGMKFTPEIQRELKMEAELDGKLEETDIATGDYGHRLRILVDEYARHKPEAKGLRDWAARVPTKAAEGAYRKLRLAYTLRWHAFHSNAMARYEAMLGD
jgi:hypothetical protein